MNSFWNPMAQRRDVVPAANKCYDRNCLDGVSHDMAVQPAYVVIHTEVGSEAAAQARFENPNDAGHASAHYSVNLDGSIYQFVDEKDAAYHAGNFGMNMDSIGIEHEDKGDYNGPRTPALYRASALLVRDICNRYAIPIDRAHVRIHKEVSDAPTACPDGLDAERIVRMAGGSEALPGDAPAAAAVPAWNGTYPMPDPPPSSTTVFVEYDGVTLDVDGVGNPVHWYAGPDREVMEPDKPVAAGLAVHVEEAAFDGVNWWDRPRGGAWWLLDSAIDGTDAAHPNGQTPVTAWNEAHKPVPVVVPPVVPPVVVPPVVPPVVVPPVTPPTPAFTVSEAAWAQLVKDVADHQAFLVRLREAVR